MAIDRNPTFGADVNKERDARTVADLLWKTSGGDFSRVPYNYLEQLGFEYSDGSISILDQLSKVELSYGSYEEFSEVVDKMVRVNPEEWPDSDSIVSIPAGKLLYEIEPEPFEFSEFDWDFADPADMSNKMELFFKKAISSVYTDGVTSVTDSKGNPPNAQNNYLMAADGKSFSGIFYDAPKGEKAKNYTFTIKENSKGKWEIRY